MKPSADFSSKKLATPKTSTYESLTYMTYKTPQEAIAACEAENERAWEEYVKMSNLNPAQAPDAFNAAKAIFRAGYMAGAKFVSSVIVEKLMAHGKTHIIEPNSQT